MVYRSRKPLLGNGTRVRYQVKKKTHLITLTAEQVEGGTPPSAPPSATTTATTTTAQQVEGGTPPSTTLSATTTAAQQVEGGTPSSTTTTAAQPPSATTTAAQVLVSTDGPNCPGHRSAVAQYRHFNRHNLIIAIGKFAAFAEF